MSTPPLKFSIRKVLQKPRHSHRATLSFSKIKSYPRTLGAQRISRAGSSSKSNLIVIVGPTASGKSDLAVRLAKKFNGEIISADSRQVYRGLDIGTGKITKKEMRGIPHYLLDVVRPKKQFNVTHFTKLADEKIKKIIARGKTPIVVGGTGFWIDALIFGSVFPEVPPNPLLRRKLEKKSARELFLMLVNLDPKRARAIDAKNPRRLIRAIEIARALGKIPKLKKHDRYNTLWIGINPLPEILREKIKTRLAARIHAGMITEAKNLRKQGLAWKRFYELGLEYRFCADLLRKKISKEEFFQKLLYAIVHYAKRQRTWFKRNSQIHWIANAAEAEKLTRKFLKK